MVVTTAERSDWTLPTALADGLTARCSEVLDALRVISTFEVLYSSNAGEWVICLGYVTLFDTKFDAAIFDAGGCPELDV
jgi:hypothetical protein